MGLIVIDDLPEMIGSVKGEGVADKLFTRHYLIPDNPYISTQKRISPTPPIIDKISPIIAGDFCSPEASAHTLKIIEIMGYIIIPKKLYPMLEFTFFCSIKVKKVMRIKIGHTILTPSDQMPSLDGFVLLFVSTTF